MFRGYHPLREIYLWSALIYALFGGLLLAGVLLDANYAYDYMTFRTLFSPALLFLAVFGLFWLLLGVAFPLYLLKRHSTEKRNLHVLRQKALKRDPQLLAAPLSDVSLSSLPQPFALKSALKPLSLIQTIGVCAVFGFLLVLRGVGLLIGLQHLPAWLLSLPILFSVVLLVLTLTAASRVQKSVAERYIWPSLKVTRDMIVASYGSDTVSMRWKDVRYFAMVTILPFSNPQEWKTQYGFELSDGENVIYWHATLDPRAAHRFTFAGKALQSPHQYEEVVQTLAAFIISRAGRPLYDLRQKPAPHIRKQR
ncbi:hypothetical protein EI42_03484 [Thermosporothrix hazakensis]|jgi:hypothetical protein|uniref:Uncharacterized protein n=1 Tax=Thermosporothrix hazakensis TaxID=644383 RepID=A0A326U5Z7_THEHA|nr:hypothetical protein [Thermosporothrix hazakensis]PZW27398.1 hypothetical protein EI42_03484 [Thermosporothrix hazakensis]GCE45565.1 hypothetical protein KTH_04340 [Thermosporothrix hazakensis]